MNYLGLAWLVGFDFNTFIQLLFSGYFLVPALTTLYVTVAAMTIGIALGLLGGLGKLSKFPLVRWVVATYLWVFRGTPVLVQIIFWYDATAELTGNVVNLPALVAGILALGVNEGAYMTEIVRAGLLSVDTGQHEAARAVGMTYSQVMRHIVIPQALRVMIPPTANEYIGMLKATSLLFAIAVPEIFSTGSNFYSSNFRYFEALSVVSIWYLLLSSILTYVQSWLERRFGVGRMNIGRDKARLLSRMFGFGSAKGVR